MEEISKLTPVLYNKNEINFNHNGLGKLTGLLVNEIEEVLNGQFEALFEYPANGRLANKIDNKMLIKAKPNRKDDPHVFRVYDYVLDTISQTYTIYARSKNIDDLGGNMVLNVHIRDQTPNQAWNMAQNNALEPVNITFESDITTKSTAHWERRSLLSVVAGEEESMIQYWGGEIKHGNGWVWLYRRRGQDNVTTVRHGKNLSGLTATYSTKGLVTAIVPYYEKRATDDREEVSVYGNTVESQYVNNYPHVYYETIAYNDEDLGLEKDDEPEDGWSDTTIKNAMNTVASEWFTDHTGVDLPSINMEIALEDISQTEEYERFKDFEQIEIGDTITIYSQKFDLNVTAKVRRVVYDGLTDKNTIVEVGTVSRSIYDDFKDLVNNRVDGAANQLQEGIDYAITSANGKNTNYYGTADPNEAGLKGRENDTYFRTNGQYQEIWMFRGGIWVLEISDITGERIKADVAVARQVAEEARENAEDVARDLETGESFFNHAGNIGLASKNADGTINSILNLRNNGTAYLSGNSIVLDGDTIVDGTFTVTNRMIAENAEIDGAKIANATILNAKIANLDVSKISGNITNFISSYWNSAAGGGVSIDGGGVVNRHPSGEYSHLDRGAINFYNRNGQYSGRVDSSYGDMGTGGISIFVQSGNHFSVVRETSGGYVPLMWVAGSSSVMTFGSNINMNGNVIVGASELRFFNADSGISRASAGNVLITSRNTDAMLFGASNAELFRNLDMKSNTIINQSDLRLKENIELTRTEGIKETKRLRLVDYDWKQNHPAVQDASIERQFGILAQDSLFLQTKGEDQDSYLSINLNKLIYLNTLTNQELIGRIEMLEEKLNG